MKRSIVYTGVFSVMLSVSAMTGQALAAGFGNLSDAITTSIVPAINWVEMPEISPEVSAAVDLSSTASTSTPTPTTPSVETATPEKSPESMKQDSERMRGQTEQSQQAPEKLPDDMDMKSERMRKVGSPRY